MKIKVSLHLHSHEDQEDRALIDYDLYGLIDAMSIRGFKVIASTCHGRNVAQPEHVAYAEKKGILLLTGVELGVDKHRHVLVLNCGAAADGIRTISELRSFKADHPECFMIAPHPNHGGKSTITLNKLAGMLDFIDAVEHSWFYTAFINPNKRAEKFCLERNMPFIATSDAHYLKYVDTDYAEVEVEEISAEAVFAAIKAGRFRNFTIPKTLLDCLSFIVLIIRRRLAAPSRNARISSNMQSDNL